ncbi:hypothetical protein P174DRAFT_505443 [Aspergillus novofumigatus IBT 16806]|uniref:Uncharacterized protein n=1 Tax=Aspergillus novofumigatus (strain IBT 16806) TaxID=1392255 RepID=A0A2I1C798_ASPN1|nr:hypothetical protein P174DRAFT_505443 [Aspergillus novofumigatus IBT 16806]
MGARAAGHRANGADRAGPTSPRRGGVPSEPVRTQVIPSDRPRGRWRAAAYGPRVGGPDPADTPTKGGSRGAAPPGIWVSGLASGQRSTDSIGAGTKRPPGFGHPSDVGLPGVFKHGTKRARDGRPSHVSGSRARPLLDAPNTVDSLDDPTKDAARRPLESRNHGWDGRLPPFLKRGPTEGTWKKWPAQSSHATRGDAALAFHIEPPTSTGPTSCGQTFPGPDLAGGGPFCMGWSVRQPARPYKVGLSGSPVAWAARGLGQLAPSRARAQGRSWPTAPAPWPPSCPPAGLPPPRVPANWSPRGARARLPLTPVPAATNPKTKKVPMMIPLGIIRLEHASIPTTPLGRPPHDNIDPGVRRYGTGGPCRPGSVQMSGGACMRGALSVYGARGSPVPIRARAGQLVTPGARAPGLYRPRCLCVSTSVCLWRAPLPAGLPPKGPRQLVTGPPSTNPSAPDPAPARRLPPRQLGQPTGRRPPPPRAHLRASLLPPSSSPRSRAHPCRSSPAPAPGPYDGARARGSLLATSARAPAQLPSTSTSSTPRARASDGPSLTHTHRPRPAPIVRANVPGSESRSGGGPLSLADRAPPTRPCAPANWPPPFVTRRRRARAPAAGQGARPAISDRQLAWSHGGWRSEGTGRRRSPASPEKGVWPPSKRPALPDPLVGGVCQQI